MSFLGRSIMLSLLLAVSSFAVAQGAVDQIEPITSALRAGQFDTALQLLQPELKRFPKNPQLWTLRGIALSSKRETKGALAAFRQALAVAPDYLPALEGAAQIEYEAGGKDASALLQHVLKLRPNEPTSHAMLAVLAYRKGDCDTAVKHFMQSGTLVDSQAGALRGYGDCLVRLKENEKAIAVYARALSQSDADPAIRYHLASVQMMVQRPKDAIATLQPALQQEKPDSDLLDLAASAYEADGNTPEAVRILRQAIVGDPGNANLYVDFANLCIDHQSFQVGIDMMNAGLKIQPDSAPLYVARGILYVQLAQYENAEADFESADAIDPQKAIGSAAEGLAAVQKNDPEQALATVRSKLAKTPNDAFLVYLQAQIIAQKGADPGSPEFREAMASAKKAITLRPSLGAARDILAKLYLQQGENELAIEQCRKALNTDPKDQTALYHLIQALRKSGKKEDLPELLKRLAALREEGTKEEAEHNRYKLVENKPAATEGQP
jgi:tetratricopeptide (TPR) repeat protein